MVVETNTFDIDAALFVLPGYVFFYFCDLYINSKIQFYAENIPMMNINFGTHYINLRLKYIEVFD